MLYQSLLATVLLVAGSSSSAAAAAGIERRQAETPYTTVVTMTLGPDESSRPLICPCPTTYSHDPLTGGQYTLPVTSASGAVAKKRQDPYTTTITENVPGTSVIVITATCSCPPISGGSTTAPTPTPTSTSAASGSAITTTAPSSSTTPRSSATSSAPSTTTQGNGASALNLGGPSLASGALVAAMVAGAAFLALVA